MKTGKNSGMTLTELIIASILVGIVTMGLIAAEQTVRMSRQSSARDNQVTTNMQAMMLAMTKDVNLMSGDYASPGYHTTCDGTNATLSVCLRHAAGDVNRGASCVKISSKPTCAPCRSATPAPSRKNQTSRNLAAALTKKIEKLNT